MAIGGLLPNRLNCSWYASGVDAQSPGRLTLGLNVALHEQMPTFAVLAVAMVGRSTGNAPNQGLHS